MKVHKLPKSTLNKFNSDSKKHKMDIDKWMKRKSQERVERYQIKQEYK